MDQRRAILERVAHEVVRQKVPSCRTDIDEKGGYINVREPARLTSPWLLFLYAYENRASLNVHGNDFLDDVVFIRM